MWVQLSPSPQKLKNKFMKNKTIILSLGILAAALIGSFLLLSKNPASPAGPATQEDGIVLFYGISCPHCALVNDFIQKNGIKEKVAFKEKEVYSNRSNAEELVATAEKCGILQDSIGVPFLWDGSKCLIGDKDIIDFFEKKADNN